MDNPDHKLTFDMSLSSGAMLKPYIPLRFSTNTPSRQLCQELTVELLNHFSGRIFSRKRWEKEKTITLRWKDEKKQDRSTTTAFKSIVNHLLKTRSWPKETLPSPISWMDSSVVMSMNFHAPANEDPTKAVTLRVPTTIGGNFPIIPAINREGIAFSSMQLQLQGMLLSSRKKTVENSNQLFKPNDEWLEGLMSFLNLSVSVVDATLFQIYYKAQYDGHTMGWRFDISKLGSPVNRRLKDKLKWISKITGKHLDDVRSEVISLEIVKKIRNHFNHFDPPAMAFAIEDVAQWLNTTKDVAQLLWKIRRRSGCPPSPPLIEMLLCPSVEWVARDPSKRRVPPSKSDGYASCEWPAEQTIEKEAI